MKWESGKLPRFQMKLEKEKTLFQLIFKIQAQDSKAVSFQPYRLFSRRVTLLFITDEQEGTGKLTAFLFRAVFSHPALLDISVETR